MGQPADAERGRVGAVLHGAGADTKNVVDAHSVAVASMHGRAVVVTADPDDICRFRLTAASAAAQIVPSPRRSGGARAPR